VPSFRLGNLPNMLQISLNLSPKHRLDLKLVKKRGEVGEGIFPDISELRRARRGHKFSRFFRHIFEHKNIKKILGSNLALVVLASSTLTGSTSAQDTLEPESTVISNQEVHITTQRSVAYPVDPAIVNQGYHFAHPGVDFEGVTGDPVNPILAGVVERIDHSKFALGNAVLVRHSGELSSIYAHLSKIDVEEGQAVTTYTKIGEVGTSGRAFGDHLHIEVYQNGHTINPFTVLPRN